LQNLRPAAEGSPAIGYRRDGSPQSHCAGGCSRANQSRGRRWFRNQVDGRKSNRGREHRVDVRIILYKYSVLYSVNSRPMYCSIYLYFLYFYVYCILDRDPTSPTTLANPPALPLRRDLSAPGNRTSQPDGTPSVGSPIAFPPPVGLFFASVCPRSICNFAQCPPVIRLELCISTLHVVPIRIINNKLINNPSNHPLPCQIQKYYTLRPLSVCLSSLLLFTLLPRLQALSA
jgi:hypothetical protein